MSPAEPLDGISLQAALGGQMVGHRLIVLEETTSTNDVVAQMAADHSEGLVVIAELQTAGRGQYGRRWESSKGKGLWLSVLLRPEIPVADSSRLTDFLAHTIQETITEFTDLETTIKPPNDIYLDHRKVAGVLVEMRVEANGKHCAIAGMGLNVNHTLGDFPAALQATAGSLALATGGAVDRLGLTIALLRNLNRGYAEFRE